MTGQHMLAGLLPWALAAAGVIVAGLWLRFATAPVAAAFRIGRLAERRARRPGDDQ